MKSKTYLTILIILLNILYSNAKTKETQSINISMTNKNLILKDSIKENRIFNNDDYLKMGGAFRYTYMKNSWNKTHDNKGGQVVFDVFILSAKGRIKNIDFEIETRYYAESFGGFMIRNGYVSLPLNKKLKLKLGMPRTPFGLLPYTGNSFMFNMPYYLGFEDDADFGLLLEYNYNNWEAQLNFDKNSEDVFSSKNNRYAYDISGNNEELNQVTGRIVYHFGNKKLNEIGFSSQYGQIYNEDTEKKGDKYALAIHSIIHRNRWDIKAEALIYGFSPKDTISTDYITLGAFAANYELYKKGLSTCLSISYNIPINHRLLKDIKLYNDFSSLHKRGGDYGDSFMNVTGCMIHVGPIYMLVDYVLAKNHPWIGNNYNKAFFTGDEKKWNKRFNVNLGIYF